MRDVAPSTGRPTLDKPRPRRDASKVLAVALQTRYRRLLEANGEDETVIATADLAQTMYENIEFVIWALKHVGGMHPPPPEELRKITPAMPQGFVPPGQSERLEEAMNKPLDLPCNCPPMEPGIIGYKHMASCPKFVPA
jgi:hypothetical protein